MLQTHVSGCCCPCSHEATQVHGCFLEHNVSAILISMSKLTLELFVFLSYLNSGVLITLASNKQEFNADNQHHFKEYSIVIHLI